MKCLIHVLLSSSLAIVAGAVSLATTQEQQYPFISGQSVSSNGLSSHSVKELLSLHRSLVEHASISGNEHDVGRFLVKYLQDLNFTVETQAVDPVKNSNGNSVEASSRFNIYAYQGSTRNTPTILSSHIDTVPPFWPYELKPDNGNDNITNQTEIWGRGTVDAKGCVAAQIAAYLSLLASNKISREDVGLLFVTGEEINGDGMKRANDLSLNPATVIFGEPTELKLASGHKGMISLRISAHGKASHSGYPWLGRSANSLLVPVLAAIDRNDMGLEGSPKYGDTTINIGKMEGGVAGNVMPEEAYAMITIRLAAGTPQEAKEKIIQTVKKVVNSYGHPDDEYWKEGFVEVKFTSEGYAPVDIDADVDGFEVITVNYGTDIPNLDGHFKRYLYGPGSILVAHSDHEHLTVGDLLESVEGYKKLVLTSLPRK